MAHPVHRVRAFESVKPYTLRVRFDDDTEQISIPPHSMTGRSMWILLTARARLGFRDAPSL